MKILEILWENRLDFIDKKQDHRDLMNDFDLARKIKQNNCKTFRVWTKNIENFEIFKKILRFFDQNLYGKLSFFTIFYLIFLGFLTSLRKYRPLEDNTRFLQPFFRFRGRGVPAFPPSTRYWYRIFTHDICSINTIFYN